MKYILLTLTTLILSSCISDSISISPADQPSFSADTIALGDIWADELSPTAAIRVYNRSSKGIVISSVDITGPHASAITINVDGSSTPSPVEIRQNDSIYILAAATPTAAGALDATLQLTVNGTISSIPISATVTKPLTLTDATIAESTTLSGDIRIFGTLSVDPSATLTLLPATTLWMHSDAAISVGGTLNAQGSPAGGQITIRGDRTGFVASSIPYTIMPGQWRGLTILPGATLAASCTSILNPAEGVDLRDDASAVLTNCRLSNSAATLVSLAPGATLTAAGCEFAEAAGAIISLSSASVSLYRCTLANNYLFAPLSAPAISGDASSTFAATGSIIYLPGAELSSDIDATFAACLFGSSGTDDTHFINCLWATDPQFQLDLTTYTFDYRLAPESPARAILPYPSDLTAHVYPPLPADRHGTPAPTPPALLPLGPYN